MKAGLSSIKTWFLPSLFLRSHCLCSSLRKCINLWGFTLQTLQCAVTKSHYGGHAWHGEGVYLVLAGSILSHFSFAYLRRGNSSLERYISFTGILRRYFIVFIIKLYYASLETEVVSLRGDSEIITQLKGLERWLSYYRLGSQPKITQLRVNSDIGLQFYFHASFNELFSILIFSLKRWGWSRCS